MILTSHNPAKNFEQVFEVEYDLSQVDEAVGLANKALPEWRKKSQDERNLLLSKLVNIFEKHEEEIAQSISLEMGKPYYEAQTEAKSLSARVNHVMKFGLPKVATERIEDVNGETRYHSQGVAVILGPFNFPAHLLNAYVIPALLTGNTVVVKPSEVCPKVGQIYANCLQELDLPEGVFNLVQGDGEVGKLLVAHKDVDSIIFTGSYPTGRAILAATLDQPWKKVSLEMGGKNAAVVLDDADVEQTITEIALGALLTSGQRCTATSRVLVEKNISNQIIQKLKNLFAKITPKDPFEKDCLLGPLANKKAFENYDKILAPISRNQNNVEVLVEHKVLGGGAFVSPSLFLTSDTGITHTELFGPNVCIEVVESLEDAVSKINLSGFGLSSSVFTKERRHFEIFYDLSKSGVLNWNKSTNGASGLMPFGGLGRSGNQRPGGIEAVKLCTYPTACNFGVYGKSVVPEQLKPYLGEES